jgi:molybdopterin-guanine dinucleotide biosynthesis protein A
MSVSSIILAGGKNLRMGRNKAFELIGGKPLIERVVERLTPLSERLIIVSSWEQFELPFASGTEIVPDLWPHYGPLGGIYTGLMASPSHYNIVVACDMPFLNTGLIQHMVDISGGYDAVIPRLDNGMVEPLHAVYSRECLDEMKKHLESGQLKVYVLLQHLKVRYMERTESEKLDPQSLSFFNINQQSDLEFAISLAEKEKVNEA